MILIDNNEIYHYHLDHLGTPQEMTDSQGKIVWSVSYKAYGNLAVAHVNEIDNPIRFQGQYHDIETGLHYNRHRYYDPNCGQFISQDPIGLLGGLNNYQYVPNPTGWIDPLGLSADEAPSVCPKNLRTQSPIDIPDNAVVKGPIKKDGGYNQVSYKWQEDVGGRNQKFEARWHEPTPNAPEGTKPNWRVTRTLSGTPDGKFKRETFELIKGVDGSTDWVPSYQWNQAADAYRTGKATPEQADLLTRGHFE